MFIRNTKRNKWYYILNDKIFVIIGLIVAIVTLTSIFILVGQGNVRDVQIFWPEKVEQTVAFVDINGEIKLIGISGTADDNNPTLIIRTNYAYVLTVENHGNQHHRLYIEGFNV